MSERSESTVLKTERRRMRSWIAALLIPASFIGLWMAPLPLEQPAHRLAAIFAAVVLAWVTEVIPISVTALLIAPAMIAAGVTDPKTAFAPYADPLLFLFVGGFFIARAMTRHRLDRRIAMRILSARVVGSRPKRVRFAFIVAGAGLSMWISNTATTAILLPILIGTFDGDDDSEGQAGDILAVAYGCSIGGLGTLVGSPPNGITARLLDALPNVSFGFVEWTMVGLPTTLVCITFTYFLTLRLAPPKSAANVDPIARPWSRGEKVTALAFGLAVLGWMGPPLWAATGSELGAALKSALPGGAVALLAASVLFFFFDEKGERVLPWNDAAKIDWGIIMLFGGGISLGQQMFDTGLAHAISRGFVAATGIEGLWTLTAVVVVFTIFFTEVCSNTASANMLVPLVIAVADELGVSPLPPALGVGLAASCAFMLPIATGPNAIAYGSGRVQMPFMMRTGVWLNLLCALGVFATLRLCFMLYGWAS